MNNATIIWTIFHITCQGGIRLFAGNKLWFCSSIKLICQAKNLLFSLRNPCPLLKSLRPAGGKGATLFSLRISCPLLKSPAKRVAGQPLFSSRISYKLLKSLRPAGGKGAAFFSLRISCKLLKSLIKITPPPPPPRTAS